MLPYYLLSLTTRPISTNRLGNCCSITGSYTPYFSDSDCLASHALCTVTLSSASVTNPSSSSRGLFLICSIASLAVIRSEEHTSELQSRGHLVCRLLLEKKKKTRKTMQSELLDVNINLRVCSVNT